MGNSTKKHLFFLKKNNLKMPKYTFYYFPVANRAGAIRDAFRLGNIEFENKHISSDELMQGKADGKWPLGAVPVLEIDGKAYCQSLALLTYVGGLANLIPKDPLLALKVNEIVHTVEEAQTPIAKTMRMEDAEEKKKARLALTAEDSPLIKYLNSLAKRLSENEDKTKYVGTSITIADLRARHLINWIGSGVIDHVPKEWIGKEFPTVVAAAEATNKALEAKGVEVSGK